jgi:L-lysine exporter family protein LysE/ArgO
MLAAVIHGWILAFGLIIPLGVQNVFVFNQGALQPKWLRSLPAVLTAAICDTLLISLAVTGVSLVVLQVSWLKWTLFGIGFIFLIYMGWSIWRSAPDPDFGKESEPLPPSKQIAFALSVSLLNPHAILDTIGVIGTSSLQYVGAARWAFTLSCIIVSWVWFFGLSVVGRTVRTLDAGGRWLKWINRLSAIIIWGVAALIGQQLAVEL